MAFKVIDLGYVPRVIQKWLHNKLKRFNVIVCHRRFGKTVMCIAEINDKAFANPLHNPQYAYIAPTYAQAKKVAWQYFKDFVEEIPGSNPSEKDLRVRIPRGKDVITYYLIGAENPDSVKGIYLDGVVFDEYAQMKPEMYSEVIRPTLSDREGWAIFIGTVKGRNHFYKWYMKFKELEAQFPDEYFTCLFKASQTKVIPEDDVRSLKLEMSADEYEQEYECDWGIGDKSTFYGGEMQKAQEEGRITRVPYDPSYPVDVFIDLGMNDKCALWFRQTVGREFRYINFMHESGVNIPMWVGRIRETGYMIGRVVIPHDGKAREISSGETRQQSFWNAGIRAEVQPKQQIMDGINAARVQYFASFPV